MKKTRSTTVCAVLKDGKVAIGADGQATMGNTVAKSNVNKIRVLHAVSYTHLTLPTILLV